MTCPRCGQLGEAGRYCVRCGTFLAPPTRLEAPPDARDRLDGPSGPSAWTAAPPTRQFTAQQSTGPDFPGQPYPKPPGGRRPGGRGPRTALIVVAVVALLALAGGVVAWVAVGGGGGGAVAGPTAAVAPPSTAAASTSGTSAGVRGSGKSQVGGTTVTTTATTAAAPSTQTTSVPAATGLSDVPAQAIGCDAGFVVQLASETTPAAFVARVDAVRTAGQLPAGSQWADTATSCPGLFSATAQVLYAGPFAGPYDGCPTRLVGPWDAFVKSVGDPNAFVSCLCPQEPAGLPVIGAVGQQDVWVGELQRMLRSKLDYQGIDIDARPADGFPGAWGTYTQSTADAVTRFQADRGLPPTGQVDAGTWAALRSAGC